MLPAAGQNQYTIKECALPVNYSDSSALRLLIYVKFNVCTQYKISNDKSLISKQPINTRVTND